MSKFSTLKEVTDSFLEVDHSQNIPEKLIREATSLFLGPIENNDPEPFKNRQFAEQFQAIQKVLRKLMWTNNNVDALNNNFQKALDNLNNEEDEEDKSMAVNLGKDLDEYKTYNDNGNDTLHLIDDTKRNKCKTDKDEDKENEIKMNLMLHAMKILRNQRYTVCLVVCNLVYVTIIICFVLGSVALYEEKEKWKTLFVDLYNFEFHITKFDWVEVIDRGTCQ